MRNIRGEKITRGYVLHLKKRASVQGVFISGFSLVGMVLLVGYALIGGEPSVAWWALALVPVLVVGIYLSVLYVGYRMVLDASGVRIERTFGRPSHLCWGDVRDWGISSWAWEPGMGDTYSFYFSPTLLPIVNRVTKQFSLKKGILQIQVADEDIRFLDQAGVWAFCRECLSDCEISDGHPVPMFYGRAHRQ